MKRKEAMKNEKKQKETKIRKKKKNQTKSIKRHKKKQKELKEKNQNETKRKVREAPLKMFSPPFGHCPLMGICLMNGGGGV